MTGDKLDFCGEYVFPPYGSLMVIDDGTPCAEKKEAKELKTLDLSGNWSVSDKTINSITLDKCTYWFDGELMDEGANVLDIVPRAGDLERAVDVRCQFKVNMDYISDKLYFVCETPEIFDIRMNGEIIDKTDLGYFRDKAFRMIDVKKYAKLGENVIELSVKLEQIGRAHV